jgi:hypothetical protein
MNHFTSFRRRLNTKKRRPASARLELESLEARNLLSDSTLGPLVQVTGTDPFAGSTADNPASQPGTFFPGSTVEPYIVVNPTNPKNLVGGWTQDEWSNGGGRGIGIAVSFNGGNTWKTGVMQGLTLVAGGPFERAGDSWLSFAPNGDLYFTTILVDIQATGGYAPSETVVEKSTDGGLDWSAPVTLIQSNDPKVFNDKDSVTADPTAPGSAYAVWDQLQNGFKGPAMIARTTDAGQSWSTPGTIFDPGGNDSTSDNQIIVLPNGILADSFAVVPNATGHHQITLNLLHSLDKGQTWEKNPVQIATVDIPSAAAEPVSDPNTGQTVDVPAGQVNIAMDPHSCNLYAVWMDSRFSNLQHVSIAFSMSTDGGYTWSAPIQINQTPSNIPSGNQQAFLPSIAVAANGTVAVTYYDFRFNGTGPGLLTDYWLVEGKPGTDMTNPANWGNEVRLTNTAFNLEQASVRRGLFIGDYQGFAAAGNDFDAFFAATNGTDPGDIFFRDPPAAVTAAAQAGASPTAVSPADQGGLWGGLADSLAVAAGLALPLPGQAVPSLPAVPYPAEPALPPLPPQAIDRLFAAAGEEDGAWDFAAAQVARDRTGDGWGADPDQTLGWQDPLAALPPSGC